MILYYIDYTEVPNGNFQAIIKYCQELKEFYLENVYDNRQLTEDDLEFLVKNISPKIVRLNLSKQPKCRG